MENKTSKYFKYAIGEIVLVVIGILIALQINNWNNNRIANERASQFETKLKIQLKNNISRIEISLGTLNNFSDISNNLIYIIGNENVTSIDSKIDSLVSINIFDWYLNLNMDAFIEGRENGDLALIKSDTLRESIYNFNTEYQIVRERERIANQDLIELFIPYLNKNFNYRNAIHAFLNKRGFGASTIYNGDNSKMLVDQEFENLIISRMMYNQDLIITYQSLYEALKVTYNLLEN